MRKLLILLAVLSALSGGLYAGESMSTENCVYDSPRESSEKVAASEEEIKTGADSVSEQ